MKYLWLQFKVLLRMCRQASTEWVDDNAQRLGASIAFYTLLSLAPVIVIVVAVAAIVYGHEASQSRLASEIQRMVGSDVARTIQETLLRGYQPKTGAIATLLGLTTLAFAASSMFVELHDAMNAIWDVPRPLDRNKAAAVVRLIRGRLYSFATVLSVGFLLLVSLVLNAWIAAMRIAVPRAATFTIFFLVIAVLFAALYKVVPDVSLKWTDVALGALITSLLFTIGKQLAGLYFAKTRADSEGWRSAFRTDVDHDSEVMPISVPN
jgi:membrane protein